MADTSGHGGFDHFTTERFVLKGDKVTLLPDPMGGRFSVGMTPEQAEYLCRHIARLAAVARASRHAKYPGLYPDDAPEPGVSVTESSP